MLDLTLWVIEQNVMKHLPNTVITNVDYYLLV